MDLGLPTLRGIHELEQTLSDSHNRPVLLFKHSYTCGISAEALDELRSHIEETRSADVQYAVIAVQTHRDLCNSITERLGVRHETPQAILVRAGRAIWSASHFRVNAAAIQKALSAPSS